jgi:hypothetical protein
MTAIGMLSSPEGHQSAQTGSHAAEQRAQREDRQPDLEHPAAAEPVGQRPGQHQQAGDGQRVGVNRPLQAAHRRVQAALDLRQGHVDDGDVDADDEQAHAADRQHQVAPRGAQFGQ